MNSDRHHLFGIYQDDEQDDEFGAEDSDEEEEEEDDDTTTIEGPSVEDLKLMITKIPFDVSQLLTSHVDLLRQSYDIIRHVRLLSQRYKELYAMSGDEFAANYNTVISSLAGNNLETVPSCYKALCDSHSLMNTANSNRLMDSMIHLSCPGVGIDSQTHLPRHEKALFRQFSTLIDMQSCSLLKSTSKTFHTLIGSYSSDINAFWGSKLQDPISGVDRKTLAFEAICQVYTSFNCNSLLQTIIQFEKAFNFSVQSLTSATAPLRVPAKCEIMSEAASNSPTFDSLLRNGLGSFSAHAHSASLSLLKDLSNELLWSQFNSFVMSLLEDESLLQLLANTPSSSASSSSSPSSPSISLLSHLKSIAADLSSSWNTYLCHGTPESPFSQFNVFHTLHEQLQCPHSETPVHTDTIPLFSFASLRLRVKALMSSNPSDAAKFAVSTNSIEAFMSIIPSMEPSAQSICTSALFSAFETADLTPQPLYRMRSVRESHKQFEALVVPFVITETEYRYQPTSNLFEYWCLLLQYFQYQQRENAAISRPQNRVGFCVCSFRPTLLVQALKSALTLLCRSREYYDRNRAKCDSPKPSKRFLFGLEKLSHSSLFSVSASDILFQLALQPSIAPADYQSSCSILKSIASFSPDMSSMAHALSIYSIATGLYLRGLTESTEISSFSEILIPVADMAVQQGMARLYAFPEFRTIYSRFLFALIVKFGSLLPSPASSSSSSSSLVEENFEQSPQPDFIFLRDAKSALRKVMAICGAFVRPDRPAFVPYARLLLGELMKACGCSAILHMDVFERFYSVIFLNHSLDGKQDRWICDRKRLEAEYMAERDRVLGRRTATPTPPQPESRKRKMPPTPLDYCCAEDHAVVGLIRRNFLYSSRTYQVLEKEEDNGY